MVCRLFFFHVVLVPNCGEDAIWQMQNNVATFCDTHKMLMPFIPFVAIETQKAAINKHCFEDYSHGMASVYCQTCHQYCCDKCARKHSQHNMCDAEQVQQMVHAEMREVNLNLAKKLGHAKQQQKVARELWSCVQVVCNSDSIGNIIIVGKQQFESPRSCVFSTAARRVDCQREEMVTRATRFAN